MEMKYLFSYYPFNTWILKNVFIYEQNRREDAPIFLWQTDCIRERLSFDFTEEYIL